ncbi:MAG TPA: 30S ribosomal protein S8 [Polyangiaceae bacterium]|jgi:small subunit ribosomal protein S8|nr:30S ribosomal protein S8 [Polyangiaceae bacterium]
MTTDPIADMLARIRNASMARHASTAMPASKIKKAIALILKAEGFIADVRDEEVNEEKKVLHPQLRVVLKYNRDKDSAFAGMRRVSRPGRRVYVGYDHIPRVLSGLGVSILSTSHGVMTDKEARQKKVGGELLCEVW